MKMKDFDTYQSYKSISRTVKRKCLETGKEFTLTQTQFGETWFPDIKYCDEVLERMEKEFKEVERKKSIERIKNQGNEWIEKNVPPIYLEEIDRSKPINWQAFDKATDFDAQRSMLLVGDTRKGKTRAIMEVIKQMARRGYRPVFCTAEKMASDLGMAMTKSRAQHAREMHKFTNAEFLAIDDLGKENVTERVQADMFEIFNARFEHKRLTCITTNWAGRKLIERYPDKHLATPLVERFREFCQIIKF